MAGVLIKIKTFLGLQGKPTPVPPAIPILLEHRDNFLGCVPPRNKTTDTPLISLYRMYAAIVMDNHTELRNEFEYFWGQPRKIWSVSRLPEPNDPDPERYAIISVIPELLCESFNYKIELGIPRNRPPITRSLEEEEKYKNAPKVFETPPPWCSTVPPLETWLILKDQDGYAPSSKEDEAADQKFLKKNILIRRQTLFFI